MENTLNKALDLINEENYIEAQGILKNILEQDNKNKSPSPATPKEGKNIPPFCGLWWKVKKHLTTSDGQCIML